MAFTSVANIPSVIITAAAAPIKPNTDPSANISIPTRLRPPTKYKTRPNTYSNAPIILREIIDRHNTAIIRLILLRPVPFIIGETDVAKS